MISDPTQRRSAANICKFLALLLVFTLVARGTSGATLARVELAAPVRSEIVDAISGSATVSTAATLDITVPRGLTVVEMLIGTGREIEAGEAVAVFDIEDVEELRIREAATLNRMELDLERLERSESIDASPLDTARRNLTRAQEDYATTVQQGAEDIAAAQDELEILLAYDTAGIVLPAAVRAYQRAREDYYAVLAQAQSDILAAEENARNVDDTALQNAIRNHERALEDYAATYAQGETDITDAQETLAELLSRRPADMDRTSIENAARNLQRARDDYTTTEEQGEENMRNARSALNIVWAEYFSGDTTWAEVERVQNALFAAESAAEAAQLTAQRRVEDAQAAYNQARRVFDESIEGEIERAEAALETAQTRAADNLTTAARRVEDAEVNLSQAQRNFENSQQAAQTALETAQNRASDNILTATRRLEDAANSASTEIERAEAAIQTAITRAEDARLTAARRVEDTTAALNTAQQNHQRNVLQNTDTASQNVITAATLRLDFYAQQSTVETLDGLIISDGVLYANYSGVVAHTLLQGAETTAAPLVSLRDTAGGFAAQMQIPAEDAERLAVGVEAEVSTGGGSMFFTQTTTGAVSAISSSDENDNATVTINLPEGNWNVGQRIDAEIVISRANYDMSVPISALNSDNAGYFLYVLSRRNTVLGLQNVAERVNVTLVAADGDMVAIRGPISRDSQIIIGSNKPVSNGDRVRVAE